MPVIVNAQSPHPFLPSLGDPAAIEAERARRQDIRPMEVLVINLMADKMATERQLAHWFGNTPLQVQLTFATTDQYYRAIENGRQSKNTPPEYIRAVYNAWSDIKHRKFDGLVITGTNALEPTVAQEAFWPEVQQILDWSNTNVLSSLFLCWGAKAALKHFHDIESDKGETKTFGLFEHRMISDVTGVLAGFPDRFSAPVARWKNPRRDEVENCTALEILADSAESGPNMLAESAPYGDGQQRYPKRLYVLNHPEYETDTLKIEFNRDFGKLQGVEMPRHYFPDNDPMQNPINSWRHTAHVYTNWIKLIYEATQFDLNAIPVPFRRERDAGLPPTRLANT
jgi:homoserine O-succinyltransferase